MNVCAAAVDGREATHEERFLERDGHVPLERDPHFAIYQSGSISQRPRSRPQRVVARVGDRVPHGPLANVAGHLPAEADRAGGELLPLAPPVGVPPPALVNSVQAGAAPPRSVGKAWGRGEEDGDEECQGEVPRDGGRRGHIGVLVKTKGKSEGL